MTENELYHYGVLGMKWGVRRTPAQLARARGKSTSKTSSSSSEKKETSSSTTKKKLSEMSDDEIKKEINRMRLEKDYKDLMQMTMSKAESRIEKGKKFVEDIVSDSAKNIGKQLVTYAMGTAVNKAFKGIFDDPSIVNPKKGQKDK